MPCKSTNMTEHHKLTRNLPKYDKIVKNCHVNFQNMTEP